MNKEKLVFRLLSDLDSKTNNQTTMEEKKIFLDKVFNENLESASVYADNLIKKYSSKSKAIAKKLLENNEAVLVGVINDDEIDVALMAKSEHIDVFALALVTAAMKNQCCEHHEKEFKDQVMRILGGE